MSKCVRLSRCPPSDPAGGAPAENVARVVDHLFRREAGRLVAILARRFGAEHLHLAEDVVQDALVKSWQGYDRLRDKDKLGPWFLQIVVNECRRWTRRGRRWREFAAPEGTREGPERQVIEDQDLRRALGSLTPDQRLVILAHLETEA